ncbi:BgTH12-03208 [Blumeria graminis f. sp. triticale]|uniref:Bgt-4683 n=3 Tax=Blumeria graminis TaxID=34373 RepID=A0A061HQW5_BLUGR|nr:hypothetical protein BGT96224_4683 [Blumeria graminis f. sp. tritici 96224]CAD6503547.1 BgTH12-03208 [Blumeria graminis f. sp. triticale]VDB89685.1 Bgt-4683 [Blumeria graminis f. sp. tritici]
MSVYISNEETDRLKASGWRLLMIGVKQEGDIEQNTANAKKFVEQAGGKVAQDVNAIKGFYALFPPSKPDTDHVSLFCESAGDILEFAEEDTEVHIQK